MNNRFEPPIVYFAAMYWVHQLVKDSVPSKIAHENSHQADKETEGALTMLRELERTAISINKEQAKKFLQCLIDRIIEEGNTRSVILDVAYGPNWILAEAIERAELPRAVAAFGFPLKTLMRIDYHNLTIGLREGYGAPWKLYYSMEEMPQDTLDNIRVLREWLES